MENKCCVQFTSLLNSVPFRPHSFCFKQSLHRGGSADPLLFCPATMGWRQIVADGGGRCGCSARKAQMLPFKSVAVTQSPFHFYLWDEARWESEWGEGGGSGDLFRVCEEGFFLHLGNQCALLMLPMSISISPSL